jgi:hypothetical protein
VRLVFVQGIVNNQLKVSGRGRGDGRGDGSVSVRLGHDGKRICVFVQDSNKRG